MSKKKDVLYPPLKNGTLRGEGGKFIGGAKTGLITPENARDFHALAREKRREAVAEGIQRAVENKTGKRGCTPDEALSVIAEKVAETALNPTSSRQVEASKFVCERAGWETTEPVLEIQGFGLSANGFLSPEVARMILDLTQDIVEPEGIVENKESENENGNI